MLLSGQPVEVTGRRVTIKQHPQGGAFAKHLIAKMIVVSWIILNCTVLIRKSFFKLLDQKSREDTCRLKNFFPTFYFLNIQVCNTFEVQFIPKHFHTTTTVFFLAL